MLSKSCNYLDFNHYDNLLTYVIHIVSLVGAVFDRPPDLLRYTGEWSGGRPEVAPVASTDRLPCTATNCRTPM